MLQRYASEPRKLREVLVVAACVGLNLGVVGSFGLEWLECPVVACAKEVAHPRRGRGPSFGGLGLRDHGRIVARDVLGPVTHAQTLRNPLTHLGFVRVAEQLRDHARKGRQEVALAR